MVRLFLKNSDARMDQIRTGAREGDPEETEKGAHSLKSSAANIGAETLRTLVTQIESAALNGELDSMLSLLPGVESAYAAAIAELESIEKGMPADES